MNGWWVWILLGPLWWASTLVLLRVWQMDNWRRSLVAFEIRLPRDTTVDHVSRWVGSLRAVIPTHRWWSVVPRWPIGVEITATEHGIHRMILVPARYRADVQATLSAILPGARVEEQAHYVTGTGSRFQVAAEATVVGAAQLLATVRGEDTSRHILAALQPLQPGEVVRVQWLLASARSPRKMLRPDVSTQDISVALGAPWVADDPLLLASCRVGVHSEFGRSHARRVLAHVWSGLRGMNTPRVQLTRRVLPGFLVAWRLAHRSVPVRRWPMVLTSAEIAGLIGLAAGTTGMPGIPQGTSRVLPAPPAMPTSGLVVAAGNYPGGRTQLHLSTEDRLRHMWIVGPTGSGKSTLLANMIRHGIYSGDGLVVVDARGDLIDDILDRIPSHRRDDVIVIDPTTSEHVVGINPLQAGPPEQAAGFVYHVLQVIYTDSWGPRTADVVRASLLTLTATQASNQDPFTLIDIPELLTNARFRKHVTSQPLPEQLRDFWRTYDSMPDRPQANVIAPVLNKLRAFTLSQSLRALLGQSQGIPLSDVLSNRRILLVALKKGLLGAEVSSLIGSLVIASTWQAALARANLPKQQRHPVWLYIDEFQDTVHLPLDLADMLAQARGLGLGMVLAHQYLGQLPPHLKAAVIGTARSHLMFQLGLRDAGELAAAFAPLTGEDLANLGPYEIALRPCIEGATASPVTGRTYPQAAPTTNGHALAAESRLRYGHPASEVDAQIRARATAQTKQHSGAFTNRINLQEPQP